MNAATPLGAWGRSVMSLEGSASNVMSTPTVNVNQNYLSPLLESPVPTADGISSISSSSKSPHKGPKEPDASPTLSADRTDATKIISQLLTGTTAATNPTDVTDATAGIAGASIDTAASAHSISSHTAHSTRSISAHNHGGTSGHGDASGHGGASGLHSRLHTAGDSAVDSKEHARSLTDSRLTPRTQAAHITPTQPPSSASARSTSHHHTTHATHATTNPTASTPYHSVAGASHTPSISVHDSSSVYAYVHQLLGQHSF